jgi:hypothetical protein
MGDAPKKLVHWSRLVPIFILILAWAGYRLYTDHKRAGGWEQDSLIVVGVTVFLGLVILLAVFWFANRPESGGKP